MTAWGSTRRSKTRFHGRKRSIPKKKSHSSLRCCLVGEHRRLQQPLRCEKRIKAGFKAIWHAAAVDADGKNRRRPQAFHVADPRQIFLCVQVRRHRSTAREGENDRRRVRSFCRTNFAAQELAGPSLKPKCCGMGLLYLRLGATCLWIRRFWANKANATRPEIEQIREFRTPRAWTRKHSSVSLYVIRRRIEKSRASRTGPTLLHRGSMSCASIIYKAFDGWRRMCPTSIPT